MRAQVSAGELQTESYLVLREDVLEWSPEDGRHALIRPLGFEAAILFRDDLAAALEDSGLVLAPLSGPLKWRSVRRHGHSEPARRPDGKNQE